MSNVTYPQITFGVSRRVEPTTFGPTGLPLQPETGGGDMNGTAAISIMHGHAGTGATADAIPRLPQTVR